MNPAWRSDADDLWCLWMRRGYLDDCRRNGRFRPFNPSDPSMIPLGPMLPVSSLVTVSLVPLVLPTSFVSSESLILSVLPMPALFPMFPMPSLFPMLSMSSVLSVLPVSSVLPAVVLLWVYRNRYAAWMPGRVMYTAWLLHVLKRRDPCHLRDDGLDTSPLRCEVGNVDPRLLRPYGVAIHDDRLRLLRLREDDVLPSWLILLERLSCVLNSRLSRLSRLLIRQSCLLIRQSRLLVRQACWLVLLCEDDRLSGMRKELLLRQPSSLPSNRLPGRCKVLLTGLPHHELLWRLSSSIDPLKDYRLPSWNRIVHWLLPKADRGSYHWRWRLD